MEPHARRVDEGFSEARVLKDVTLLHDKIRVASGRRAVAMATGVIDRIHKHGQVEKQVLVVVTSDWSVMCFDHNLQKLWETNLQVFFCCLLILCCDVFGKVTCGDHCELSSVILWFSSYPIICRRIFHIMLIIGRYLYP